MARFVRTEKAPEDDDARQTWLANRTEAQINADVATGDHRKRMRLDDDLSEVTDSVSLRSDSSATASAAAAATPPTATCECDPDPTRTHARPHSHVHTMQQHSQRHGVGALVDTRRAPFPPPRVDADTSQCERRHRRGDGGGSPNFCDE